MRKAQTIQLEISGQRFSKSAEALKRGEISLDALGEFLVKHPELASSAVRHPEILGRRFCDQSGVLYDADAEGITLAHWLAATSEAYASRILRKPEIADLTDFNGNTVRQGVAKQLRV